MKQERVLPLTLDGFLTGGPEAEKIEGICRADDARSSLICDIYNGLPGWIITEVTFAVNTSPHGENDVRYYQIPTMIKPRTAERITVVLGLELPPDDFIRFQGKSMRHTRWGWQNVGAKGYPAK